MVTRARKYLLAGMALAMLLAPGCGKDQTTGEKADKAAGAPSPGSYDMAALLGNRAAKDEHLRQDGSPIPEGERAAFPGLRYFAPDTTLVFDLVLARHPNPEPVTITATRGDLRTMSRYGTFSFNIAGTPCTLTAFTSEGAPGALFVPFKDLTNGTDTYEVGRYLDLEARSDDRYQLDFNLAYNPYCAYNPGYTCPLVPEENVLPVAIHAGEKLPASLSPH